MDQCLGEIRGKFQQHFLNFLKVDLFFFLVLFFHRLIQDVQTYVEQLGEACAANVAVAR